MTTSAYTPKSTTSADVTAGWAERGLAARFCYDPNVGLGPPITLASHLSFIRSENIRTLEERLAAEADPKNRMILEKLLAEERAQTLPAPDSANVGKRY